ncbi:MAG: hypothetical protein R3344_11715, partial [Acidobacteriota bacterium]|nr:hypothetical protein [Acidobacteriota bacterium]
MNRPRWLLAVPIVITAVLIAGCGGKKAAKRDADRSFLTAEGRDPRAQGGRAAADPKKGAGVGEPVQ